MDPQAVRGSRHDSDLVAKKLPLIETCVRQLRTLARPEALRTAIRAR